MTNYDDKVDFPGLNQGTWVAFSSFSLKMHENENFKPEKISEQRILD